MITHQVALVVGMFAAPAWLAWLGHHMRDRSAAGRGAFWGGVAGHVVAILLISIVLFMPPVSWEQGDWRFVTAYWSLLLLTLAGAAAGAILARMQKRPPR